MSEPLLPGAENLPPTPEEPHTGEPVIQQKKTSWPDVLGILGIIFGMLGILGELGNVFYPLIRPVMFHFIGRTMSPGVFESFLGFMPPAAVIMFTGIVKMALAVLLLTGSIYLKKRSKIGVRLLRIWAIIMIPWVILEMGFASFIVRRMFPHLPYVVEWGPSLDHLVQFGMAFGMLIALAAPIFVLAWFGSSSIASETEGWAE